jgi:hypothetical protein
MNPFIRFSVRLQTTVLLLDYGTNGSGFSIRSPETRLHPMLTASYLAQTAAHR